MSEPAQGWSGWGWGPALVFLAWFSASGCLHLGSAEGGAGRHSKTGAPTLALYEIADRRLPGTGRLFRQVPTEENRTVVVRAFPVFSSRDFVSARAYRTASGRPCLVFQLDRHGRFVWEQVSKEICNRPLALVIDGVFRFPVLLNEKSVKDGKLCICGPWYRSELRALPRAVSAKSKRQAP